MEQGQLDRKTFMGEIKTFTEDVVTKARSHYEEAVNRSFQCESPTEKDDHDEVGEEGGEPDDLPRAVQTFGDDAVDTEPG